MQEVGPSGVTGNEASRDVEAGMVVEREQESLFFRAWPPLVDGTVVLEEFPESSTTKAAVGAWFFGLGGNKAGEMSFDVGFDAGSGAFEAMETEEFVGNELKIAGGLERNEFAQEGNDGTFNALAPARTGSEPAHTKRAPFTARTTGVSNPVCSPSLRASVSVAVQRLAFATGLPHDIYAFHCYTVNSSLPSSTQERQYQMQFQG